MFMSSPRWSGSGVGTLLGLGLMLLGLSNYQANENRAVLGRWSPAFFAVLVVAAIIWMALAWWVWIGLRKRQEQHTWMPRVLADLGAFLLGLGYCINALTSPREAALLFELNLFGMLV